MTLWHKAIVRPRACSRSPAWHQAPVGDTKVRAGTKHSQRKFGFAFIQAFANQFANHIYESRMRTHGLGSYHLQAQLCA